MSFVLSFNRDIFSADCYQLINVISMHAFIITTDLPGRVAQSVTCLATDACLTADPVVGSSIWARSHTWRLIMK